jgi:hypothetical protein
VFWVCVGGICVNWGITVLLYNCIVICFRVLQVFFFFKNSFLVKVIEILFLRLWVSNRKFKIEA